MILPASGAGVFFRCGGGGSGLADFNELGPLRWARCESGCGGGGEFLPLPLFDAAVAFAPRASA
jgi:hypothetical protein